MELEVMDKLVQIAGQAPHCMSKYLDKFLDSWNNTIEGRLKVLCYKNMWSTWIEHNPSLAMTTKGWEQKIFC